MPRFHFNIHDGHDIPDTEGTVLPNLCTARLEAIRYAAEVLKDEASRLASGEAWRMDVVDDRGIMLLRIDFRLTMSPDGAKMLLPH